MRGIRHAMFPRLALAVLLVGLLAGVACGDESGEGLATPAATVDGLPASDLPSATPTIAEPVIPRVDPLN